jgi:hypothetical protein
MKHRVALARQQRVQFNAGFRSKVFEAAALELVGDEDLALRGGELGERGLQVVEQQAAGVAGLGPVA